MSIFDQFRKGPEMTHSIQNPNEGDNYFANSGVITRTFLGIKKLYSMFKAWYSKGIDEKIISESKHIKGRKDENGNTSPYDIKTSREMTKGIEDMSED